MPEENQEKAEEQGKKQIPHRLNYINCFGGKQEEIIDKINEILSYLEQEEK